MVKGYQTLVDEGTTVSYPRWNGRRPQALEALREDEGAHDRAQMMADMGRSGFGR